MNLLADEWGEESFSKKGLDEDEPVDVLDGRVLVGIQVVGNPSELVLQVCVEGPSQTDWLWSSEA
jgi:hypothetical protein